MNLNTILTFIILALGIGLCAAAGRFLNVYYKRKRDWKLVTGQVLSLKTVTNARGYTYAFPVVKFFDEEKNQRIAKSKYPERASRWEKGDSISIYYDPEEPGEILVNNVFRNYYLPLFNFIVGLIVIAISIIFSASKQ